MRTTRDATLNGVALSKGTDLKVVAVRRDVNGAIARVDLQETEGGKRLFKAMTPEAIAALTSSAGSSLPDRASIFKVAAQIPIVRELSLGGTVFPRGAVLQIDRVEKDKSGKVTRLDLRETSGQRRLMRGLPVEQVLLALSPDDTTWPDGAVGRTIQLPSDFKYEGALLLKGSRLVVTRVETEPRSGEVVRVDLRESDGQKRELANVPVALLKQNGALGSAAGAPK